MSDIKNIAEFGDASGSAILSSAANEFGELKVALEARLADLTIQIFDVDRAVCEPGEPDFEDRVWEMIIEDISRGLGASRTKEIRKILSVLHHIRVGTYGKDRNCTEPASLAKPIAAPQIAA